MSLEPVMAAFFAVLFGGESLTTRMLIGGALVIGATYLVELRPGLATRRQQHWRIRRPKRCTTKPDHEPDTQPAGSGGPRDAEVVLQRVSRTSRKASMAASVPASSTSRCHTSRTRSLPAG